MVLLFLVPFLSTTCYYMQLHSHQLFHQVSHFIQIVRPTCSVILMILKACMYTMPARVFVCMFCLHYNKITITLAHYWATVQENLVPVYILKCWESQQKLVELHLRFQISLYIPFLLQFSKSDKRYHKPDLNSPGVIYDCTSRIILTTAVAIVNYIPLCIATCTSATCLLSSAVICNVFNITAEKPQLRRLKASYFRWLWKFTA